MKPVNRIIFGLVVFGAATAYAADRSWMPSEPGKAGAEVKLKTAALWNRAIRLTWQTSSPAKLEAKSAWSGQTLTAAAEPFVIRLHSGKVLTAAKMRPLQGLHTIAFKGGRGAEGSWTDAGTGLLADWKVLLRDGSNYVRSELSLTPKTQNLDVMSVAVVAVKAPKASVIGAVQGSPIVDGNFFLGMEHPMSVSEVKAGWATCLIKRRLPLQVGKTTTYGGVIGVSPHGQLRRGFLMYLERERPRPYAPFLHYNSWYDLGYFNRYNADECVERINTFGDELAIKRGVKLQSFLFDDGWDETSTLWNFHSGFPDGFLPLKEAAAKFGAAPGIWLSPWGGYGPPHDQRVATGRKAGVEIDADGYALSGPRYYKLFHDVCLQLVGKYGVNQFKFDGTGSPDKQYPGSAFGSDFEAAIALIQDLRKAKPGLFINLTTGTWPSPFWTRYADSIWRGGYDDNVAGVGTNRQRWITYRDADTYHGIVLKGPLYPLNSLMLHGLIYAQHNNRLKTDTQGDFRSEVRSYFGNGTQLQEMYITPSLLSKQNWDDIAESAKWSKANADVLVDTHWVGGDPLKLQVYGWASWSPRKSILVLRNPSDHAQQFTVDPTKVFELPEGSNGILNLHSPYLSDRREPSVHVPIGKKTVLTLKPYEVLTLEGRT